MSLHSDSTVFSLPGRILSVLLHAMCFCIGFLTAARTRRDLREG